MNRYEKVVLISTVIAIFFTNPPILNIVNNYCKSNPLIFGWPTIWLYLTAVWTVVICIFAVMVSKEKSDDQEVA
jgi:hypothetical protein